MRPLHILWFLALVLPALSAAEDGDGSHDISYLWTADRRGAEAYRELVAEVLGPEVARDLQIVIGGTGNFGVIYDRSGTDPADAQRVAGVHHELLKAAFGGRELLAVPLPDRGFSRPLDVRYGEATDLEACRRRFGEVAAALGGEIERELVVLRVGEGQYEIAMRLSGTPAEADELAAAHTAALESPSIAAAAVRSDSRAVAVWDASSGGPDAIAETEAETETETETETEAETDPPPFTLTSTDMDLRNTINDHIQALRGSGSIAADELLRLMNLPNGDRIYRDVPEVPVGTHVYDKTGTTAMLCGDMGILVARDASGDHVPYAVIGIIEKRARPASFRTWIAQRGDVIRGVSGLVYRRLGETHSLR
ncbi:MAG: hypothetical protein QGH45_01090 [Myxococcota bacterium]|nr:hypothetical protein [Myxococcota bacterium]